MDYQSTIILKADKALKDLNTLTKHMESLDKSTLQIEKHMKSTATTMGSVARASNKLVTSNKAIQKSNTEINNSLKTQTTLLASSVASINSVARASNKVVASNAAIQKSNSQINTSLRTQTTILNDVVRALTSLDNANKNIEKSNRKIQKTNKELVKIGREQLSVLNSIAKSNDILAKKVNALTIANHSNAKSFDRVTKSAKETNTWIKKIGYNISLTWRIMLGAYMAKMFSEAAVEAARLAESVDLLNKKITFFTKNAQGMDIIRKKAMEIGAAYQDMGKVITRFAVTTKNAFSVTEMTNWTKTLVLSARAVGTSTMEMNNAMIQLSQAFSAGRLMGDEYRSISENLPMLKQALEAVLPEAKNAEKGLKTLASEGKITQEVIIKAFAELEIMLQGIEGVTDTVDAAVERVKNSWTSLLNAFMDYDIVKESLNVLSGILVKISGDVSAIQGFKNAFPELNKAIDETAEKFNYYFGITEKGFQAIEVAISGIKDFTYLLKGFWGEAFQSMGIETENLGAKVLDVINNLMSGMNLIKSVMEIFGTRIGKTVMEMNITRDLSNQMDGESEKLQKEIEAIEKLVIKADKKVKDAIKREDNPADIDLSVYNDLEKYQGRLNNLIKEKNGLEEKYAKIREEKFSYLNQLEHKMNNDNIKLTLKTQEHIDENFKKRTAAHNKKMGEIDAEYRALKEQQEVMKEIAAGEGSKLDKSVKVTDSYEKEGGVFDASEYTDQMMKYVYAADSATEATEIYDNAIFALEEKFQNNDVSLKELGKSYDLLDDQLLKVLANLEKMANGSNKASSEFGKAKTFVDNLMASMNAGGDPAVKNMNKLSGIYKEFAKDLKLTEEQYQSLQAFLKTQTKEYKEIQKASEDLVKEVNKQKEAVEDKIESLEEEIKISSMSEDSAEAYIAIQKLKILQTSEEAQKIRELITEKNRLAEVEKLKTEAEDIITKKEETDDPIGAVDDKFFKMEEAMASIFDSNEDKRALFMEAWQEELDEVNEKMEDMEKSKFLKKMNPETADIAEKWFEVGKVVRDTVEKHKDGTAEAEDYTNVIGQIGGVMAQSFNEGSKAAEAFQMVQRTMALYSAIGAMIEAWRAPYPANIPNAAMTTAAVVALLAQMGQSVSGGGGGGGGAQQRLDEAIEDQAMDQAVIELYTEPMLERMDKQIELLEMIGLEGTAGVKALAVSKIQFESDISELYGELLNVAKPTATQSGVNGSTVEQIADVYAGSFSDANDEFKKLTGSVNDLFSLTEEAAINNARSNKVAYSEITVDWNVLKENIGAGLQSMFSTDTLKSLFNWYKIGGEDLSHTWEKDEELRAAAQAGLFEKLQSAVADFGLTVGEVLYSVKDATEDMKEAYDLLTDSTTYAEKKIEDAFIAIAGMKKKLPDGTNLTEFLGLQIEAITGLEKEFSTDIQKLFTSTDPADVQEQTDALYRLNEELTKIYNPTGEKNIEDVTLTLEETVNLMDELGTYSSSIGEWRDNVKEWEQRNESELDTALRLFDELGVALPNSAETLNSTFVLLKDNMGGLTDGTLDLTDAELEAMQAAEAYLKSIGKITESMQDFSDQWYQRYEGVAGKAARLSSSTGIRLATSFSELDELAESLINDTDGLVEAEYELITANEALLQSFQTSKEGFDSIINSLLNSYKPSSQLATELGGKLGVSGIPSESEMPGILAGLQAKLDEAEANPQIIQTPTEIKIDNFDTVVAQNEELISLQAAGNDVLETYDFNKLVEEYEKAGGKQTFGAEQTAIEVVLPKSFNGIVNDAFQEVLGKDFDFNAVDKDGTLTIDNSWFQGIIKDFYDAGDYESLYLDIANAAKDLGDAAAIAWLEKPVYDDFTKTVIEYSSGATLEEVIEAIMAMQTQDTTTSGFDTTIKPIEEVVGFSQSELNEWVSAVNTYNSEIESATQATVDQKKALLDSLRSQYEIYVDTIASYEGLGLSTSELAELAIKANPIIQSTITATEEYNSKLIDLNAFMDAGTLTVEQFNLAFVNLKDSFRDIMGMIDGLDATPLDIFRSSFTDLKSLKDEGVITNMSDYIAVSNLLTEEYATSLTTIEDLSWAQSFLNASFEATRASLLTRGLTEEEHANQLAIVNKMQETMNQTLLDSSPAYQEFLDNMDSLRERLYKASASSEEIKQYDRDKELLEAKSSEEAALLRQIYAMEDYVSSLEKAESELEKFKANIDSLTDRLNKQTLSDDEYKSYIRDNELADAATEAEKALLRNIYAMEDYNKQLDLFNNQLVEGYTEDLKTANSSTNTLEGVISSLDSAIDTLRDNANDDEWTLGKFYKAMDNIANFDMRDDPEGYAAAVKDAVDKSKVLGNEDLFETSRERRFEQLVAANQFEEVKSFTLTEIDYLESIASSLEKLIEETKNVSVNVVKPIKPILKNLDANIVSEVNRISNLPAEFRSAMESLGINSLSSAIGSQTLSLELAISKLGADIAQIAGTANSALEQKIYELEIQLAEKAAQPTAVAPQPVPSDTGPIRPDPVYAAPTHVAAGDTYGNYNHAVQSPTGLYMMDNWDPWTTGEHSLAQQIFGQSTMDGRHTVQTGFKTIEDWKAAADAMTSAGLSFAVGSTDIPYDMTANIHKGEIVVPRTFSDGIRSGDLSLGSDNKEELEEQNRLLKEIIVELKSQKVVSEDTKDILNESLVKLEDIEEVL